MRSFEDAFREAHELDPAPARAELERMAKENADVAKAHEVTIDAQKVQIATLQRQLEDRDEALAELRHALAVASRGGHDEEDEYEYDAPFETSAPSGADHDPTPEELAEMYDDAPHDEDDEEEPADVPGEGVA